MHPIEWQRPLKPQSIGKCTFLENEERAAKALPSAQYARILQEVNNLRVNATGGESRFLTTQEREKVKAFLCRPTSKTARRTFKSIRKTLNLPESMRFNLETLKRDHLVGDLTAALLMQDDVWGQSWFDLAREAQGHIISKLINAEVENDFIPWLCENHNIDHEVALNVFQARLPDAHGKLSKKALDKIIPLMERGYQYDEAASQEFGDHRALGDGVVYEDGLPYYGEVLSRHTAFERHNPKNHEERFGRVANPTVHVALNQIRKVINDLIKRWGPPEQIVLELARELPLSDRGLKELDKLQANNQKKNDELREDLEKNKQADTYENRLKLRLFEEALESHGGTAQCVFSGKTINKTDLFTAEIEIEHILPLSRTLDDSFANKVLATRQANREKKNNAPFEAFGHSSTGYIWEEISQRVSDMPSSKEWRFGPDAMERWEERGGDFLARQLNDTRYIASLGKKFTEAIFGGQGAARQANNVWVVTGQLTANLRHHAGFNTLTGLTGGNRKDRTDHRHHAVDALVIALIDRSMVKRAADLEKREDKVAQYEIMQAMAEPLKRYRNSAEDRLSKLVVSHKPDHGYQDAMHNDTAYGVTGRKDDKGNMILVTRKGLDALTKSNDLDSIIDPVIRKRLQSETQGLSGKEFTQAVISAGESMHPPVRRVRIETPMKETSYVVMSHGSKGQHSKAYKGDGNYCYDIFLGKTNKWDGEVVTNFQAYQYAQIDENWWRKPTRANGEKLIMRIRKNDMLEIDGPNGKRRIVVVYKLSKGMIFMSEHFEANASARVRAKELDAIQMSPSSLQKSNAVYLSVSPSGKVKRMKI